MLFLEGHQEHKDKRKKSAHKDKTDKRKDSAKPKEKVHTAQYFSYEFFPFPFPLSFISCMILFSQGKDAKGKGKGKHEEMDLFELPREHKTLGSCRVNLSTLLDGEFEVMKECICEEEEKTNVESKTDDMQSVASGKHGGGEKKKSHKGEKLSKLILLN